jgi:hypothetical protein
MQLSLNLLEVPPRSETAVWERLSAAQRQAVVAELAGMILGIALGVVPDRVIPDPVAPDHTERQSADA